jgi:hypothetical protein
MVLGFELKAYTLNHSTTAFILMGFFEIGSCKLLAWTGFKPAEILLISVPE